MRAVVLALSCLILAVPAAATERAGMAAAAITLDHPLLAPLRRVQSFDCARTTCTQIRSCEEACHKLLVCGHTQRDGDGDGIPCEELCSRRC